MLERLSQRSEREERGFTLIELMVVVLIIAILIAIAIPTFLGARQRAQDRAAQSNARNALTAEKTFFTDGQAYSEQASDMTAIEPSLTYTNAAASMSASGNVVYIKTYGTPANTIVIGAQSGSGKCFWLRDTTAAPGTQYLRTDAPCSTGTPDDTTAMTSSW
jgi:type IV pilus assembly protein PilA